MYHTSHFTRATLLLLALLTSATASAQEGGLFGWGPTSSNMEYSNRGGLFDPTQGGYNITTQQFGSDVNGGYNIGTQQFGQEVPLGGGWVVLTLAGVAYAFKKRKNNHKKITIMKRINTIIITMALLFGLAQCKKQEINTDAPATEGKLVHISVNVNQGDRHIVYPGTGAYVFENGDLLYVGNDGNYIGTLEYANGTFSGDIYDPQTTDYLHFYFTGGKTPETAPTQGSTTDFTVNIADQSSKLPVLSYAHSANKYTNETATYSCMLENKCALVKFNVTTSSTATTNILGMNNKVTVSLADNSFEYAQDGEGAITLPAGSGERWAILLPQSPVAEAVAQPSDGIGNGTCGAIPAIAVNDYLTEGITVKLYIPRPYVDLGLPSGLLWATYNVGADSPEGYGDYFAWGETMPKEYYDWSTYQYCNGGYGYGSYRHLTKYCNVSGYGHNGFTDNLTILEPGDDAATDNWGSDWRMPTQAEFQELLDNTTATWTQLGGVNGYLFTAVNGNSLFLPAAGHRAQSDLFYVGSFGRYWSSSLTTDGYPYRVWYFFFDDSHYYMEPINRNPGCTVRPVRSTRQN